MSDQLQKRATVRKATYLGVIVALFTLSMFWRGVIPLPVGDPVRGGEGADPRLVDRIARWPVRYQADDLEMRELDMGDPEIAGSAAQVSLVGFRGVVVTLLWKHAIDKQKRGEYHDMELAARMVSRMQPHFIEPWIFQAWNIAYNVSVENDKLGDQYFYIARGISLLAEGDRINTRLHRRGGVQFRVGSPDIRYQLAFYYQNKFTVSDKVATLRSLAQLSCIPPADRDPAKLVDRDTGRVDPARFLAFCRKHPQLVRRLQYSRKNLETKQTEGMNLKTPEQIVQFLAANQTIPARYDAAGRDLPDEEAFPVFPRTDPQANPELDTYVKEALARARPTGDQKPADNLDPVQAAHAWFEYGQEVVPPPVRPGETTGVPSGMFRKGDYDEFRYRIPTRPALIVFRSAPARSQTYLAERLQKEGWIDATSYWEPDAAADVKWFPNANPNEPVRLYAGQNAKEEWGRTRNLWVRYGRLNGMNVEDRQKQEDLAEITVRAGMGPLGGPPNREYTIEDLQTMGVPESAMRARMAVMYFDQNRQITNYQFFLDSSGLETDPRVAEVRQMLWDADRLHETGEFTREVGVRVAAAAKWRDAVGSGLHQAFYAGDRAELYHEFTLEQENKLTKLLEDTDPAVQKRVEEARLATLMLGGQAADVVPLFQRNLPYEEAVTRIAMAMPSAQVDQRVAELMTAAKDLPGEKPTAAATRRGVIDREFAWMKEYAEPPPPPPGRRPWVRPTVRFAYLFKMGLASPTSSYSDERRPGSLTPGGSNMRTVALAVLAHPDDVEFLCAGTLLRLHRERGWEVHVATMTAGDCGSADHPPDDIAAIRRAEGKAACDAVGFTYHCLEVLDLRVRYCDWQLERVCKLLNAVRPTAVFAHGPHDYHLDHEESSKLVRAATFAAPIPNFLHRPGHTEPHPPLDAIPHLFYCDPLEGKDQFGQPIPPAFYVDVTGTIDAKADMLGRHDSQRAWLRKHHGVDSLQDTMRAWSASQGQACGVAYAEGFRQHLGHSYPQSNLLADLLGAV